MATIHDVARAAGVSPATVSRVFNGGNVTPARVLSVRQAAAELGFAPNRVARSLRKQQSSVIALIIPDIENPFFTSLARGVEDAAQRTSLSVVLCNSDQDTEKERRYLEVALGEQMAGVIVAAASQDRTDLGPLIARGVPVVAVDRRPHDADVDAVMVDNHHGGEVATRHLVKAGYRRIACITGPEGASTSEERLGGYRAALGAAARGGTPGAPPAPELAQAWVRYADFRVEGGRLAMRELLALPEPPDAVFVANNLMTIGVLEALREARQEPPSTGVLSFGDVPWASLVRPSLTTVELPSYELGRTAAELLLQRMSGSSAALQTVVLRTTLQARESTAGPG
ncbi:LacI family DNA-binding transcriptional regulator [Streptomyces sp. NPDC057067]|uniref:LacI family DNA-binding transcriptional regulator n=1 Tax=Streptomyces TaxID=1883 RepID=UPI00100F4C0C|nr:MULTISPECIES: LacI family DNA-binding transcriptional regulator [Streptomyces]MBL1286113.1 LacI family DNA-binding transcriptional regulator [Streptomyces silvae]